MQGFAPPEWKWLEPWQPLEPQSTVAFAFEAELKREVGPQHALFGVRAVALAQSGNGDDMLFGLANQEKPLGVVHLTWARQEEADPRWPDTAFYASWDDWKERRMRPDHLDSQKLLGDTAERRK